jgi:hypothetical protein
MVWRGKEMTPRLLSFIDDTLTPVNLPAWDLLVRSAGGWVKIESNHGKEGIENSLPDLARTIQAYEQGNSGSQYKVGLRSNANASDWKYFYFTFAPMTDGNTLAGAPLGGVSELEQYKWQQEQERLKRWSKRLKEREKELEEWEDELSGAKEKYEQSSVESALSGLINTFAKANGFAVNGTLDGSPPSLEEITSAPMTAVSPTARDYGKSLTAVFDSIQTHLPATKEAYTLFSQAVANLLVQIKNISNEQQQPTDTGTNTGNMPEGDSRAADY